ncbi:ATP-binding protein [Methylobacterium komagatae]
MRSMKRAWLKPGRSIAGRIALVVTAAVTAALVLTSILSVWRELDRIGDEQQTALTTMAEVFAAGSARAALENDAAAANATLRAIGGRQGIVYGAIERPDGSVLGEQGLGLRLSSDAALDGHDLSLMSLFGTRTLRVEAPIKENGAVIGRVILINESQYISDRIKEAARSTLLVALLAVAIGIGVSLQMQRSVTRPLAQLAGTMDAVRLRHDYTRRAPISADDEVGRLARTFNDLLSAVNERDDRLAAHSAHLEQEVRARTADLSEAKQVAESANAAKSTFLATMSHEIRTPMNGVLVMAELLASSDLPARQRRYADVIARSGKSLLAIINDILDFAKVEAGKLELERVPVSPSEVADTVVTLFAERARSAGLDLAASVAPEVPRAILGDPVRLGQVASNFISNALKFTAQGHVALRLDIDPADGFLVLAVIDTGIGIPQDKLATIFSAFSQADQSTTRRFGGTGLGLSIAQRIVETMGGSVGVTSEVGVGSTFFARIPVDPVEAPANIARYPDVPMDVVVQAGGSATRAVLKASLKAAGFAPTEMDGQGSAHWILDAQALVARRRRPEGAARILVLGQPGEGAADDALRQGLADEILRWPVTQAEWQPVLSALAEGRAFAVPGTRIAQADALPRFPGMRLLVADDSAVNREVALEALSRCGVTDVVAVEDGAAAVAAAGAQIFDLILMDGSMPVMDGFTAARTIREQESAWGSRRTPIIALTAHVLADAAEAVEAAQMDGILAKPFTLKQLAALLERYAEGANANSGIVVTPPQTWAEPEGLLDEEVLESLLSLGDGEFLSRIVGLYRSQAPVALAALREAVVVSDQQAIARAAHSLKSMSANIGASVLVERLKTIETAGREGTYAGTPGDCDALDKLLAATILLLDQRTERSRAAA